MSDITKLGKRVDAARQALRQIEEQQSKYNEGLADLLKEVAECVNRKRAEMIESKAEYERIIDEYAQLKELVHSPVLTLEASRRSCLGDIVRDLDAEVVVSDAAKTENGEPADHLIGQEENFAETDPDRVRQGLHRALSKSRNNGSIQTEVEGAAS